MTIVVGKFDPALNPEGTTTGTDAAPDHPVRVAVLGRRALLRARRLAASGRVRARGLRAAGHDVRRVELARDGLVARRRGGRAARRAAGCSAPTSSSRRCTGRSARTAPSRGCSSCSTSPTSAPACWRARCAWTRSLFKDAHGATRACRRSTTGRSTPRRASRGRPPPRLPVLGQARAAGLLGRDRARRRRRASSTAALEAASPRPAGDRRGERARARGRVLGARPDRCAAGQPARRDRPAAARRLVRLRGQVHARRHGARGAGADLRRRARAGARAGRHAPSAWPAAAAWRAPTSSSTARTSCSTSSTRCPASRATSVYGKLWEATRLPYPELCDRLVRIAIERFERERAYRY